MFYCRHKFLPVQSQDYWLYILWSINRADPVLKFYFSLKTINQCSLTPSEFEGEIFNFSFTNVAGRMTSFVGNVDLVFYYCQGGMWAGPDHKRTENDKGNTRSKGLVS